MIGWYAVLKERMMGMASVGVAIAGIVLASLSGADIERKVGSMVSPLYLIASNTSDMDTKLQEVKKHTLTTNTQLQDIRGRLDTNNNQLQDIRGKLDTNNNQLQDIRGKLIDYQTVEELKDRINQISKELDKVNSVRLLIGSEDSLTTKGVLNADRSVSSLFLKKSYNLSKNLSDYSSLDTIVSIGQSFTIEGAQHKLIKGSGQLNLKRIVSHTGTLKENKDYTVKIDGTTTSITFINPLLGRMDVLAVVERRNN